MPVLAPRTVAAAKPSILTPALRQSFFDTRPTWGVCVLATVLNGGVNTRGMRGFLTRFNRVWGSRQENADDRTRFPAARG